MKEVIVIGEGKKTDELSTGPEVDEYASNYTDYLYFHKILERISFSLSDEFIQKEDSIKMDEKTEELELEGETDESSLDIYREVIDEMPLPDRKKTRLPKELDELTDDVSIFEKAYEGIKETISDVMGMDSKSSDKEAKHKKSNEDDTFDNLVFMIDNKVIG